MALASNWLGFPLTDLRVPSIVHSLTETARLVSRGARGVGANAAHRVGWGLALTRCTGGGGGLALTRRTGGGVGVIKAHMGGGGGGEGVGASEACGGGVWCGGFGANEAHGAGGGGGLVPTRHTVGGGWGGGVGGAHTRRCIHKAVHTQGGP